MKERRIELARKVAKVNDQIMRLGTWDIKRVKSLKRRATILEQGRLGAFKDAKEYLEMKENIESTKGKAIWNGCYCDWMGWGSQVPSGGWPEWYVVTEMEWQMKLETVRMEKALQEKDMNKAVDKLKAAWGIEIKK